MTPANRQTPVRGGRLPAERLRAQRLLDPTDATPAEVVADLLAVQAQDGLATKWAVGLRTPRGASTETLIDEALAAGAILRTHVMRWTWQLITPADVRWMLALVAPRLVAGAAGRDRELELDAKTYRKVNAALDRAMRDGAHLTRTEIVEVLERAKVSPEGQRLSYILGHAELAGVITSGVTRGKQTTHAHLGLRAPDARSPMPREEALAEAALRYFRSRGPATDADFAWWIGLSLTDARAGLAAVRDQLVFEEVEVAGKCVTMWRGHTSTAPMTTPDAHLLPAFDEYLVAYKDRSDVLAPEHTRHHNAGGGLLAPTVVVDGRVVGTWRRMLARDAVEVTATLFAPVTKTQQTAIERAAKRYAAFLDRPLALTVDVLA